jgi:hypothetical protein
MPECFRLARRRHNVPGTTYRASRVMISDMYGRQLDSRYAVPEPHRGLAARMSENVRE